MKKQYKITKNTRESDNFYTAVISDRDSGAIICEQCLTLGGEDTEIRAWRRALDKHLDMPGSTLNNFEC